MIKNKWLKIFDGEGRTYLFNTHKVTSIKYYEAQDDDGEDWSRITITHNEGAQDFIYKYDSETARDSYADSATNILALEKLG